MFTLVLSSVIRLSLPDTSKLSVHMLPLLTRLVRSLHSMQSTSAGDLVYHALHRALNTSARFRSTGEHPELCRAIDEALVLTNPDFNTTDFWSSAAFDFSDNTQSLFGEWTDLDWMQESA